jgi:hypothetical protein
MYMVCGCTVFTLVDLLHAEALMHTVTCSAHCDLVQGCLKVRADDLAQACCRQKTLLVGGGSWCSGSAAQLWHYFGGQPLDKCTASVAGCITTTWSADLSVLDREC